MTQQTFTYAELEGLWIRNGGSRATAPIAAAIAEAESSGRSWVTSSNPDGGTNVGPWQLDTNGKGAGFTVAQLQNPDTNARVAVRGSSDGTDWSAWETFVDGAYKRFLSPGTSPANPPGGKGGGGPQTTAAVTTAAEQNTVDCLWSIKWSGFGGSSPVAQGAGIASGLVPGFGFIGAATSGGDICLLSRSEVRALLGAALFVGGALVGLAGLAVLVGAAGLRVVPPLGKAAEAVGGALMLVPGGEGAGAAISGAGRTARNPARAGRERRSKLLREDAAAKRQRQAQANALAKAQGRAIEENKRRDAREDAARERKLGQPRENKNLEVRGGAVKENTQQRAARGRRQAAAARARAKRAAGQGNPATKSEAGF